MKTKLKLLSFVLGISLAGFLFTQCVKNEESEGVRAVRGGYAELLKGQAEYQKALADKEKAEAEYRRAQAQWDKDYYAAVTELEKAKAELEKVKVQAAEAGLDSLKAAIETKIQEQKTLLLKAQGEYAAQLIKNEDELIQAQEALAQAKADLLKNDPKLALYLELKEKLYNVTNGLYYQKKTLVGKQLETEADLIKLQYAVDADWVAYLKQDSVKAAESLKYANELLEKYKSLDGLSVAELQAQADQAKIDWTSAKAAASQQAAATVTAQNKYNEESTKYSVEATKLNELKNKLTSTSVQLVVVDSLYYLYYYSSPAVYPASVSDIVSSVLTSTINGYKNIQKRAVDRLAYLKSEDVNAAQSSGFGYSTYPSDQEPTKKYLEERIKYIEDVLVQAIDTQIAEQTAEVNAANAALTAGKAAWATAESAYKGGVTAVNNSVTALRNQLVQWKKAAEDSVAAASPGTLTTANQNAYFSAIKNYYVARYNFDRKVATGYAANYVPAYSELTAASFTASTFFAQTFSGSDLASDWTAQVSLVNRLLEESNVKIENGYEYDKVDGSVTSSGTIQTAWNTTLPAGAASTHYVNSQVGQLLYQSTHVYGANTLDDIHYFLPYDTKKPAEPSGAKSPSFSNYSTSLFGTWASADAALTTLKTNKANTFYIENYKTVLALVKRTIAYYEGLATEYGALVAETEAAVAAQVEVVNAQLKVREAAYIVVQEALARYNTANTHAANLGNVYNALTNATTGTLAIIKTAITDLETQIGAPGVSPTGLYAKVNNANKALADYLAKGQESDLLIKLVAEKEAEIAAIKGEIAALENVIAIVEAQMEELLKDE
ncbi:MAG: hypothetical protein LBN98_04620 [Prevotellaceae bacterium]|nr:hypothetical protein [Prevotellaceae bacterium]